MSYQSAQRQKLTKDTGVFSWGFVDNVQNVDMAGQFSPYLRNARLDWQSITIRPWHQLFNDDLTAGDYPRGIGRYLRADPSGNVMVIRHNTDATHKLYTLTAWGTLTSIATGADIASDNRMHFTNIADDVYCMNWVDDIGILNGTTYTTPSFGIVNFAPAFSCVFDAKHWASGWSTNSNKVYYSAINDYDWFGMAGSGQLTFQEQITWLASNGQAIFYFTPNSVSMTGIGDVQDSWGTLYYVSRALQSSEWAPCNASIVSAGSNIYFLSTGNTISMIAQGQNVNWFEVIGLSDRPYAGISKIMSTLDVDQSDSFGYFLPDVMLIKWHLKTNGSSINDIVIVYDITKDKFLVDDRKYFYGGVNFEGKNYTISMLEPKVYQDEYSQDDEWSAIPFEYHTKEFYISDPTFKKILWEARTLVDINELAELTQEIWIDWASVDTKTVDSDNIPVAASGIGTLTVGEEAIGEWANDDDYKEIYILRTKGNLNKKGRKVQFRWVNGSLAGKVRLKDLWIKAEVLPAEANNLTA